MANAEAARALVLRDAPEAGAGASTSSPSPPTEAVKAFGIDPDKVFAFWDWVGGRYSVWSAVGLPVALAVGFGYFRASWPARTPWTSTSARPAGAEPAGAPGPGRLLEPRRPGPRLGVDRPYDQDLNRFPAYLQQLEMESNGKRVTRAGDAITDTPTGPVVWGDAGTNGQHAFFQLLHQGTDVIPMEFIAACARRTRSTTSTRRCWPTASPRPRP